MILAVCQLDWCVVTLIVKVIGRAAELMYYYFNSSFGGFIRAYGNLNWVTKEPELIHWNLVSTQTRGCLIQKEKAHVEALERFQMWRLVCTWHRKSHPWHNLLGNIMKWPLGSHIYPVTALLLACSPHFFCQSTAYLRVRALQGMDNACEITGIQRNKSKQMCLRKCELCHWKSATKSSKCNPCNLFPKLQTLLVWGHGKSYN